MRRRTLVTGTLSAAAAIVVTGTGSPAQAEEKSLSNGRRPRHRVQIVGHRGSCGYRPEHTLESYRLSIAQGVDIIEPDLVPTSDGVLVARHESEIGGTTDVSARPEFAGRRTTKVIDGRNVTGWFTEDFTLAEIKSLRAKERLPQLRPANTAYDGLYEVPTFDEIVKLLLAERRRTGRDIGMYPETKHPTYFRSIGLPLEDTLVRTLRKNRLDGRRSNVLLQSFEQDSLQRLARKVDNRLHWATETTPTPEILDAYAEWGHGINFTKNLIIPRDAAGNLGAPTTVVADAQERGLKVHAWTFRSENNFLPTDLRIGTDPAAWGDYRAEYDAFLATGIDGLFTDFPDKAIEARDAACED
ncbi:glycerophosphodiester phosphodiesterase family protein [Phytomonospora sp. NPDC050363]|uniref:glycerophosphodiester phosphodiesterase family protein n=1 Tax=Phytomonospora sp. NPDC050363 TaxID=3155642 RepID=UPI0033FBEE87